MTFHILVFVMANACAMACFVPKTAHCYSCRLILFKKKCHLHRRRPQLNPRADAQSYSNMTHLSITCSDISGHFKNESWNSDSSLNVDLLISKAVYKQKKKKKKIWPCPFYPVKIHSFERQTWTCFIQTLRMFHQFQPQKRGCQCCDDLITRINCE